MFPIRTYLLLLILLAVPATHPLVTQTDNYELLPEQRHRELLNELNYNPPPPKPEETEIPSPPEAEDTALAKWLKGLFTSDREIGPITLPTFVYYLLLAILIGICGYFIYTLLDDRFLGKFRHEEEARRVEVEEIEEEKLSFRQTASLLERAEKNEQFAIAVRLQYLAVLKRLHELELIRFKKDKPNRRYLKELSATEFATAFEQLTTDYEKNWYGDYPLDRLSYRLVAKNFVDLRNRLDHLEIAAHE